MPSTRTPRPREVLVGLLVVLVAGATGVAAHAGGGGILAGARPQQVGSSQAAGGGVESTADAASASPSSLTTLIPSSPASTVSTSSAPTQDEPGGVLDAGGVDADAYRTMAKEMGTAAGVAYRFGDAATGSNGSAPTAYEPPSKSWFNAGANRELQYQIGGPHDPARNDYSSNQGQVGYISTEADKTFGVDTIETLNMDQNIFSEKPQLSWTFYGKGHPASDIVGDGGSAKCLKDLGVKPGRFVAQARSYAHGEMTANSLIVFDNGVIASAGTNTAPASLCMQLPGHLKPTAISLTNQNEFALVTVWNTATLKSELAVIALGGVKPKGQFWDYEWTQLFPGIQNYGMPTFGKLLGTVDLPMAAATGVSAVSDYAAGRWLTTPGGQNVNPANLPLADEANRQSFIDGVNKDKRATAGYAVVFSREEHKVAFVDLQPLFERISSAYFGDRSTFDSIVANVGQAANQWPYSFSAAPDERPKVVKSFTMAQTPTAVAGMLSGESTPRAYVATVDGKLHTFAVGGLASPAPASADQIVERGSIAVGANPTSITYIKDRPGDTAKLDTTLLVTSRGTRSIQWVTLKGDGGSVTRTLRDSRLVDPIAAEDNNTHGTESYVVSIADYGAARLFNYRYGPVVFHTNGGATYPIGGGGEFEFGGAYDPKGRPYSISITNVT